MAATLDIEQLRKILADMSQAIVDAKEELSEADRETGDGDHGSGMARGFSAARDAVLAADLKTAGDAFRAVGMAVLSTSGGASGAVFGTMFRAPLKALTGDVLDGEGYATALEVAAQQVEARGKAARGDKTMLDALIPAAEAARAVAGEDLSVVARAAADAAEEGSVATKSMIATIGKAKSLGERSLGYRDPGSISVAIMLKSIADGVDAA
ncbi:MAG: dihydroxyacetone kinase subunit DhaL [Ancrocorticia sp.]